jgi:TetR/AcrR family transcriptional regulator, transcriptional repressor for nem operon
MVGGAILDVNYNLTRFLPRSHVRVMRKSREAAAQTRKRIVTAASGAFRKNGIVATELSDLMSAAGLTHGGFYKHFKSKDQLVAEACAAAVETVIC